ncbi:Capreomycidine synthase [Porphyridium purpureum]|uniref:Capreomycidine synthase n=1 Tax=Porphyridium purpureum TaxID=35688 RepID=A0A5J4Z2A2_PORPP|nr:Capreomycidine synthase [Porphyridium purpureum]|eukprot:POR2488..scf295_1
MAEDAEATLAFELFAVERFMSENEVGVRLKFAESGVQPLTLRELLSLAGGDTPTQKLLDTLLDYPEVNGSRPLREIIARLYDEPDADNVLVTVGASEANFILANSLAQECGAEIAVLMPAYMQFAGSARNSAARNNVRPFYLDGTKSWALDKTSLEKAVSSNTRVISVVDPNNPTGHILSNDERACILAAAKRVSAWLVVDEVYAGAEVEGAHETPSWYSLGYEKTICVGSLSKAFGLPGLRLGWLIGPREVITRAWYRHEYVSISASALSMELATFALTEPTRAKIIQRSRDLIRGGWPLVEDMINRSQGILSATKPAASAMCFIQYALRIPSSTLAMRLLKEKEVLVVPGSGFRGGEHHFRFSYALPHDILSEGITRILDLLLQIRSEEASTGT